jgi:lipoprotein-anchoring transpeptidase ErfK/SrfK
MIGGPMGLSQTAWLCVLMAGGSLAWTAGSAQAQNGFQGGAPVFQSDVEKRQREAEAHREAIRKSYPVTAYPKFMDGGGKPDIAPEKPPIVYLDQNETPGTIIVDTGGRTLYYVLPGKQAYAYPISVGRDGFTWTGTEKISRIASWPSWTPPPEMRQRQPGLPITVSGGVINPLGAKALYLGNTIYRIHGTSNERSIGRASSSGCFRMLNQHVTHLATLARVGTTVRVVANYQGGVSTSAPLSSLFSGFSFGDGEPPKKARAKNGTARTTAARAASAKSARSN